MLPAGNDVKKIFIFTSTEGRSKTHRMAFTIALNNKRPCSNKHRRVEFAITTARGAWRVRSEQQAHCLTLPVTLHGRTAVASLHAWRLSEVIVATLLRLHDRFSYARAQAAHWEHCALACTSSDMFILLKAYDLRW